MNEGLATYADKCFKYSVEEIYAYFIQKGKLINDNDLINHFYKQNDIIAYFQAAYLVEYLLENYGINSFKSLWQSEIEQFEKIYGKSFDKITHEIKENLSKKYSSEIKIDWVELEKGCY